MSTFVLCYLFIYIGFGTHIHSLIAFFSPETLNLPNEAQRN